MQGRSVLVIGAGDLGMRICLRLVTQGGIAHLVMAGRDAASGQAKARFIEGCGDVRVDFEWLDALDSDAVADLIARMQPNLLVQCASMHSPWLLSGREDIVAAAFRSAGFAAQLPAQLPVLIAVMRAVRACGFDGAVINCSYPDVTHVVLQNMGLAPTVGIGNAGMIHLLVQAVLRKRGEGRRLRTLAHHAQVSMVANATLSGVPVGQQPRLFLDDEECSIAGVLDGVAPIPLTQALNEITAAHAASVITAWLGLRAELRTAVPGALGLPGGWPVVVSAGSIELDMPAGLSIDAARDYHHAVALLDGVERIDADGVVHFVDSLQAALARWPSLGEPLAPADALWRYSQLRQAMTHIT